MAKAKDRKQSSSANGQIKASSSSFETVHTAKPNRKQVSKLIFEPRPDWHANTLPELSLPKSLSAVPPELLQSIHEYGKTLLDSESSKYASTNLQASSSQKFMSTIMTSGTLSDKVSALTLVVQESPLHTSKSFENLVNLASKKSRSQAVMALGALKDLLAQGVILPSERKLRMFSKQPALLGALQKVKPPFNSGDPLPNGLEEAHLIQWAYEDRLKHLFFEILKLLERWCNDEVEYSRLRAVTFVWELLKEKPEQEENLLRLLVNKLGDTNKKVASRASHLILQLQSSHPSMKTIIINAIESEILLRPGQSLHAKYYAVITLNQTILQNGDPSMANALLDVYFNQFVSILNKSKNQPVGKATVQPSKKKGKHGKQGSSALGDNSSEAEQQLEDKVVAQVLTGVNRAFPYSKKDTNSFEKHLDTMFRIAHSANFNTSIQALLLIQQISSAHEILSDRYMRTLYESLLDPRLVNSSKQTMYLNLLYRSLKADASLRRVKAFVKRLLQIINMHEPPFVCAALYLIIELRSLFPGLQLMLDQPDLFAEDDAEVIAAAQSSQTPNGATTKSQTPEQPRYDPRKRDPEHCHAELTCFWELPPWLQHYHPSISLFARHLLSPITTTTSLPKPDPSSHTLNHFLDRFVYRNPKQRADSHLRGTSLMQPALASAGAVDTLLAPGARGDGRTPLNSEAFWKKRADQVAPDEVFFHRYFAMVGPRRKVPAEEDGKGKRKTMDDMDEWEKDEADVGDEEEIWKALVDSRPELEGDIEDEGFSDEEDLDVDYDDSDEEDGGIDGVEEDEDESDFDEDHAEDDDASDGGVPFDLEDEDDSDEQFESENDEMDEDQKADEEDTSVPSKVVESLKRKENESMDDKRKRRKKLRNLPTFASADDYAHLLDQGDDGALDDGI